MRQEVGEECCDPTVNERSPPVLLGESTALNKERAGQAAKYRKVRDANREVNILQIAINLVRVDS